jgi:hypothetical protein
MNLFSGIEKTIERGFRKWTDRMLGPANSDEVLLVHRAILEAIEAKVQTVARGQRVFPYSRVPMPTAARSTRPRSAKAGGWKPTSARPSKA